MKVVRWIRELGLNKVGIMPISTELADDFYIDKAILESMPSKVFVPYLLISPEMYDFDNSLQSYDSLHYKAIKIHAFARKEWYLIPNKIRAIIEIALKKDIPVIFHTGGWHGSNAIQFYKYCREFPQVNFILAHGRPISQTLTVLKGNKNIYVDSSFLPIENIKLICDLGLSNRILFGTDFPIMKTFWPEINLLDWYRNNIIALIKT
ncbi:amidohydrolase family protein, partial [Bacteroidota bacterium]